eukprot:TRINITY_DN4323_c0_g1_i1.p1 TRINITY_DN4323_c0_g1~~TRINITY_DN4323_c0_g1_i1.p1  ORF type:complete len:131 (+),score=37.52 TRINITY_DN4323_c0_g1_i1:68-460(+)
MFHLAKTGLFSTTGLRMLHVTPVMMTAKKPFNVIADLCVVPIGVGTSVSKYVAVCEDILKSHNLNTKLHSYGTDMEGDWEDVMNAMRECHETLHEMGAPRITSTLKFGTRVDKEQTMEDKIKSVEAKISK